MRKGREHGKDIMVGVSKEGDPRHGTDEDGIGLH